MMTTRRNLVMGVAAAGIVPVQGRIEPSQVTALMSSENLDIEALMVKLLPEARSHAHPPLSHYSVGAVALGSSGSLYLGQNIEIPGNMLGLAVHAEQSAIANAYMSDEKGIDAIAVTAAPCGHCRQFLSEVALDLKMRVLILESAPILLSELLPRAFGPKDLGFKKGAFPVTRMTEKWTAKSFTGLAREALNAAAKSYSPYSRSPSGVAISTSTRGIFSGSYIENAAFNPSLPPLETALAGYFAAGAAAGEIQSAVLMEGQRNAISHEVTTRSVLMAIAPGARFERMTFD